MGGVVAIEVAKVDDVTAGTMLPAIRITHQLLSLFITIGAISFQRKG